MSEIGFQTTQNVEILDRLATLPDRIFAWLIDGIILGAYGVLMRYAVGLYYDIWVLYLIILIPASLYHLLCETFFDGASVGKMALGIKVVGHDGTKARFSSLLIRWAFRLIDITVTIGSAAILSIGFSNRSQRLGDLAAGTVVIKAKDNVDLNDTIYTEVEEGYQPVFKEASLLSDKDILIINDTIKYVKSMDTGDSDAIVIQYKLKKQLETKLQISSDMVPMEFLKTIKKDYNSLHR